jgi:dTMP kinase
MVHTPRPGRLIVIEGIDGAGKSTIVQALGGYCRENAIDAVLSREPTKGQWGQKLRDSALKGRLSLEEELELFLRDRAEHVQSLIAPALAEGKVVLLDRYYFSTAAYQGARGADPQEILRANEQFAPQPDLVLLLDLDPCAGRSRIQSRGDTPDAFEEEEALARVRRIFLSIERPYLVKLDASEPSDSVRQKALLAFQRVIDQKPRLG